MTHIMQVRDLKEMLDQHPQDAEVVILIGGTEFHICEVGRGGGSPYRRKVGIVVEGEDRIKELEGELVEVEEKEGRVRSLLEEFDRIMEGGGTNSEMMESMTEFSEKVAREL